MSIINNFIKKKFSYIITILVIIQPIIDVLTSFMVHYGNFIITIGVVSKVILLLFILYSYFIVFKLKSMKLIIYLLFIFLYVCLFVLLNNISDAKELFKILYLPASFVLLYEIFKYSKTNVSYKSIIYMLVIYSVFIIIPYCFNIGFDSYDVAKKGSLGWFNSANEISAIFAIILPLVFYFIFNKFRLYKILLLVLFGISIFIVGTKTPLISLIVCLIYYAIKYVLYLIKSKKHKILVLLFGIFMLMVSSFVFIIPKTYIYKNTMIHLNYLKIDEAGDLLDYKMMDHFMLGSRLSFAADINKVYVESSVQNKIFGIGFQRPSKLAEMDFVDIFYRMGIIGIIIVLFPIIHLFITNRNKDRKYYLSIFISILVSIFAGHILTAPSVSFILSILIINCLLIEKEVFE